MASAASTTFPVSDKKPEKYSYKWIFYKQDKPFHEQIKYSHLYRQNNCTEILQMTNFPGKVIFADNGFVNTVVDAYNHHHNLVLRPDDVWAAIMTQFSFYINKNSEQFRDKFVNFQGKKQLEVEVAGTLKTAPYDTLVKMMTKEIDRNLVDSEMKKWILPNFSTTTDNDLVTVGVIFMASMKKYFDYKFNLRCGIPNVTLEGTAEDWQNVLDRLDKLKEYNLTKWYDMLQPILEHFVSAKRGKVDQDFWGKIAHYERGGSGPTYISGWITAFCVFDKDGNWQESNQTGARPGIFELALDNKMGKWLRLDTNDIPTGIVEVNVLIDDNGIEHNGILFAGHLAAEIKGDGDTVQPALGWLIALKGDTEEGATNEECKGLH